ncbi:origin recognition complex subunit 2 [Panus rudis PR-1116 ss-1]|nr:origin recognition complex subunit 2 [Panus rudis PR-1116 ss-1]
MEEEEEYSSSSEHNDEPGFSDISGSTFAATSFDQYFLLASKASRTSSNVYSSRVEPISPEEYTAAVSSTSSPVQLPKLNYRAAFPSFLLQLEQGFNLLFYGAGSKRSVLNAFIEYMHSRRNVCVVVANAFNPAFAYKDLVNSIERMMEESSLPQTQRGIEGQVQRINRYFTTQAKQRLLLVVHNIENPSLLGSKTRSLLSSLCSNPRIHVIASVDHIASPLLWSLNEIFSRKSSASHNKGQATSGYSWLYHDITTLENYDFELSSADRTSLSGASQSTSRAARARADRPLTGPMSSMTEVAARHILLSVTEKAKKLFVLLASKQLESTADTETAPQNMQEVAVEYSTLFNLARENFIATNDTAFRALMSEFKDHGLMMTAAQGAGEVVWIPLRKSVLTTLMNDLRDSRL